MGLPLLALGQQGEPQQSQEQTKDTQTTSPAKTKKMRPEQEQPGKPEAKPETGTNMHGKANVQGRTQEMNKNQPEVNRNEAGVFSSTNESNMRGTSQTTTVNKQEFMSRHSEVLHLGRRPKEFFIQRYGASHVRLIANEYFVFVDGCWVAVDVDGFVFSQRVICAGDPEFVEVE